MKDRVNMDCNENLIADIIYWNKLLITASHPWLLHTGPYSAKPKWKLRIQVLKDFIYSNEYITIERFKHSAGDHQLLGLPHYQQGADVTMWQGLCVHPSGIHAYAVSGVLGGVLALHCTRGAQQQGAHYERHGDNKAHAGGPAHCLVESALLPLRAPQTTGRAYAERKWIVHNHTGVLWACELTCCRHLFPVCLLWYARHLTRPVIGGWTHH